MNQWKASIVRKYVQVAILPLIIGCYFSTIDHYPLSNMMLCPTAFSYKMVTLNLSQKYSTAYAVFQIA